MERCWACSTMATTSPPMSRCWASTTRAFSAYTLPPLTTVRQPAIEMGRAAATSLLRLIDGDEPMLPHFLTDLVIRKSVQRIRQGE